MEKQFAPAKGDVIWLDFVSTRVGGETVRRPAMVVSDQNFNTATGRLLACPVSTKSFGADFEVPLSLEDGFKGYVACDHIRNIDWRGMNAELAGRGDAATTRRVMSQLESLLGIAS